MDQLTKDLDHLATRDATTNVYQNQSMPNEGDFLDKFCEDVWESGFMVFHGANRGYAMGLGN